MGGIKAPQDYFMRRAKAARLLMFIALAAVFLSWLFFAYVYAVAGKCLN